MRMKLPKRELISEGKKKGVKVMLSAFLQHRFLREKAEEYLQGNEGLRKFAK